MICLFFFFPSISLPVLLLFFYRRGVSDGLLSILSLFDSDSVTFFLFVFLSDMCLAVYPTDSTVSPYLIVFPVFSICLLASIVMYNISVGICPHLSDSLKGSFVFTWVTICRIQNRLSFFFIKSLSFHLSFLNPSFAPAHLFFPPHSTSTLSPSSIHSFFLFLFSLHSHRV